ncbi:restriction endonuclease subunit S [Roseivirga sp.]|uniref:restriction endonuclease subunit S n=1 Tax=Roseivirga sp. TaxID=1964215 RepID=UPI003B51C965
MIRTTNVKKGRVNLEEVRYVTKETFKKWTRRSKPRRNDIILTREAPLGEVGLLRSDEDIFLGQRLIQYRANPEKLDQLFLYYAFQAPFMQGQILAMGSGSTVEHLRIGDCEKIQVKYPPLPTQKKIASILSAYDELIENNNQRIKLLEQMAEEIYKEWFVRLRFPGYQNTKIVDGKPEGWNYLPIRECLEFYIGGGWGEESRSSNFSEPAYVVRGTDIPEFKVGNLNYDVLRYHKKSNLKTRRLRHGDIIFEVSGGTESQSLGRSAFVSKQVLTRFDHPVICASFCKLIRANLDKVSPFYLYSTLQKLYATGEIMTFQVQSTGISNYQFEDFINFQKILTPSEEVTGKFDQVIEPTLSEIQVLGAKNETLKKTRDLLLPRLISGKLSVEHLLENIEEVEEQVLKAAEPTADYR